MPPYRIFIDRITHHKIKIFSGSIEMLIIKVIDEFNQRMEVASYSKLNKNYDVLNTTECS